MMEVMSRALKLTIRSEVCARRRMRSCTRLAMPRLAMMKSRVMGPGTPSVRLSPLPALASSPSLSAPASPPLEPDDEPATSWKQQEVRLVIGSCLLLDWKLMNEMRFYQIIHS